MKKALMISNRRTREMGGGPEKEKNKDLLEKIGWEVEIAYIPTLSIYSPIFIRRILNLTLQVRSEDIDIMVTHCSPPQLHLIGYILKKTTGVPWLAEFRDPLATNVDVEPGSFLHFRRRILEKRVVQTADKVVWWDGIQMEDNYFYETYPNIPESRFYKIPYLGFGGVDIDKFDSVDVEPYEDFTITYAGSFYDGWIEPYAFLEGVKEYVDRHGSDGLQVQFYGDWKEEYQQAVEDKGLEDTVTSYDPVPYDDIISILKKSDLLLHIGGNDPRNELNIPLKIADYVAARSPVLGVVDPSFRAGEFIKEQGIGVVAPPEDPESIAEGIHTVQSGNFKYSPRDNLIDMFDSRSAMDEYASLLDSVSEGK